MFSWVSSGGCLFLGSLLFYFWMFTYADDALNYSYLADPIIEQTNERVLIMRWMKWIGVAAAVLLVISCFLDWVVVVSKNIHITGVNAAGTYFGKPGYFNLVMTLFFVVLTLIPRIWAKRLNLLVTAMNFAWAMRNYFIISACRAGECPEKHAGIYLLTLASFVMLVSAMFPDLKLPAEKTQKKL